MTDETNNPFEPEPNQAQELRPGLFKLDEVPLSALNETTEDIDPQTGKFMTYWEKLKSIYGNDVYTKIGPELSEEAQEKNRQLYRRLIGASAVAAAAGASAYVASVLLKRHSKNQAK